MHICPNCKTQMEYSKGPYGKAMQCKTCKGTMMGLSIFKKITETELNRDLWGIAVNNNQAGNNCPECNGQMKTAEKTVDGRHATLDICTRCHLVWIEGEHLEATAKAIPMLITKEDTLPPEARQQLAILMMEAETRREREQEKLPGGFQVEHLGLLLGPAEADRKNFKRPPYMTWAVIALTSLISLMVMFSADKEWVYGTFGFLPSQGLRYGGITFITSFFLHGSVMHLLGNMYFLWIFGKNTEYRLGTVIYLVLIFASTVVGNGLHAMFTPDGDILCIGASGGVSGVLIFYCLNFYKEDLLIAYWWGIKPKIAKIPAIVVGFFWLAIQGIGAMLQVSGHGNVSYLSHLGGAIIGTVVWWMLRDDMERLKEFEEWQ